MVFNFVEHVSKCEARRRTGNRGHDCEKDDRKTAAVDPRLVPVIAPKVRWLARSRAVNRVAVAGKGFYIPSPAISEGHAA